jgi:hypothetical protein
MRFKIRGLLIGFLLVMLLLLPAAIVTSQPLPSTIDFAKNEQNVTILGARDSDLIAPANALAMGDVNGDGKADILVGAPGAGTTAGRAFAGQAYLIPGMANPPLTIDLAQAPNVTTFLGAHSGDALGTAVAVGDLDGDHLADVIISAPDAPNPRGDRQQAGVVYVFTGHPTMPSQVDVSTAVADMTIVGAHTGDRLGEALAVCDLNGDGIPDLIVGDPRASGAAGPQMTSGAGVVYIFFGKVQLDGFVDLSVKPADVTIYGPAANASLGFSLGCGDLNGDGKEDLIIGAPGVRNASGVSTGAVYGILGKAVWPKTIDLAQTNADVTVSGATSGGQLGFAVAAGDLNGDGLKDLIAADPAATGPGSRAGAGAVYVISGGTRLLGPISLSTPNVAYLTIYGANPGDRLGASLAVGDINSDGIDDLLIGDVNATGPNLVRSGAAFLFMGGSGLGPVVDLAGTNSAVRFLGANSGSQLGISLAIGDFDGDGAADMVLGAPFAGSASNRTNAGTAYLVFGSRFGTPKPPKPAALKGDVNLDGKVDILDAQLLANYIVGLAQLNETQKWAGDVTPPCRPPDTNIDANDVRTIAEFAVGNITSFDCSLIPPNP